MVREYSFYDGGTIVFDDSKAVRELIEAAFDAFDYYEPAGMDIVTVFQASHPDSFNGWFTTDTGRSCSEEIKDSGQLFFAYYMPDAFYFAEGGWGHHMTDLGNHPVIPDPISLKLKFDDFNNEVVINGNYTLGDVIDFLSKNDYISGACQIKVLGIGTGKSFSMDADDPVALKSIKTLKDSLNKAYEERFGNAENVSYFTIEFIDKSNYKM